MNPAVGGWRPKPGKITLGSGAPSQNSLVGGSELTQTAQGA